MLYQDHYITLLYFLVALTLIASNNSFNFETEAEELANNPEYIEINRLIAEYFS